MHFWFPSGLYPFRGKRKSKRREEKRASECARGKGKESCEGARAGWCLRRRALLWNFFFFFLFAVCKNWSTKRCARLCLFRLYCALVGVSRFFFLFTSYGRPTPHSRPAIAQDIAAVPESASGHGSWWPFRPETRFCQPKTSYDPALFISRMVCIHSNNNNKNKNQSG